tara:strand:- start:6473 stop:6694 length:222 start_codon:yes stop_codon:yes gene_type:complete
MIVCVCKAVSDKTVRRMVQAGASSVREVSRETGLGTCCGVCVPHARQILAESLSAQPMKLADLLPGSIAPAGI